MIFGHRREEQGLKVFYENTERRTRFASTSKRREGFDGWKRSRKKKENEPTKRTRLVRESAYASNTRANNEQDEEEDEKEEQKANE